MGDKLITVAKFANTIEAQLAKQLLADSGIKSIITGGNIADLYHLPAVGMARLETFESQAQKAKEILESNKSREQ